MNAQPRANADGIGFIRQAIQEKYPLDAGVQSSGHHRGNAPLSGRFFPAGGNAVKKNQTFTPKFCARGFNPPA